MSISARLADVIERLGRPMTLRRNTAGPGGLQIPFDVDIYGVSRNYDPHELVSGSGVVQGDTEITFSGRQTTDAQWPGPPKKLDVIVLDGRNAIIQSVEPKNLGADLLVYVAQVRG